MLDPILASVRRRLDDVVGAEGALRAAVAELPPARDFAAALSGPGLGLIAEFKRRSPSAGPIAEEAVVEDRVAVYEAGGASAVSVLTEPDHFGGSLDDLRAAVSASGLPVLRKDFVLHPAQIWEARAAGADAVLLIVAALSDGELLRLAGTAAAAGLAALVEVHTEDEARRARDAGAALIGVNNRDLATFRVDLATAERLRALLPVDAVTVAESGVSDPAGAARMAEAGYDAVLVGEALMRTGDPGDLLQRLRGVR